MPSYEDEVSDKIARGIIGGFFSLIAFLFSFIFRMGKGAVQSSGYHKPDEADAELKAKHQKFQGEIITEPTASLPAILVNIPRETIYDGDQASDLMAQIFKRGVLARFSIWATSTQIGWFIEAEPDHLTSIARLVRSFYPGAQVEDKEAIDDSGFYHYSFEGGMPCVFPMMTAVEFNRDPLHILTSLMDELKEDDQVLYQLLIQTPDKDYHQLGSNILFSSNINVLQYLTDEGANAASSRINSAQDLSPRYVEEMTDEAISKLKNPVWMEARVDIKIKAVDEDRAIQLFAQMGECLDTIDREKINGLYASVFEDAYPLVLTAGEAASLWHLPTADMYTEKISAIS